MKKTSLAAVLTAMFVVAMTLSVFADGSSKEVTITGEGMCAKCALHETAKCQNVIQVTEDGKKVNYFLTDNKVSKAFHENLCQENKKVTATGKVSEKDGKKMLTITKIELAK